MEPLTAKQEKVLKFIEGELAENNVPSQQEIAAHFRMSQNAAFQLVGYLRKKGYLAGAGKHRGMRLSQRYLDYRGQRSGIPIVGRVAAGTPILAEENIEGYLEADELLGVSGGNFVLKVAGDSMVDAGIFDGDLVVVEPATSVGPGRIGVVMIDDEVTVKRIYMERDRIVLEPANKRGGYKIRYVGKDDGDVRIVGKVVACVRKM